MIDDLRISHVNYIKSIRKNEVDNESDNDIFSIMLKTTETQNHNSIDCAMESHNDIYNLVLYIAILVSMHIYGR